MDSAEVLKKYKSLIVMRARRLAFIGVPFEDAMQECCLRVIEELPRYDPNRGDLSAFISCRLEGIRKNARLRPSRLFRPMPDYSSPTTSIEDFETHEMLSMLQMKLLARLDTRERLVWSLMFSHNAKFSEYLERIGEDEPCIRNVAPFVGLSMDSVRWSIGKIKHQLTLLMDTPEFESLKDCLVRSRKWPTVHVSNTWDGSFARSVMKKRELEPVRCARVESKTSLARRVIEDYPWGVVVFVRHKVSKATIVAEGEFTDDRLGRVTGACGFWRTLHDSIGWYSSARRECLR